MTYLHLHAESEKNTKEASDNEIRVYEVFGMGCPACHGGLNKLLKKIEGVKDAVANWKEQQVTITLKHGADVEDEQIFEVIRKANFTPGKRIVKESRKGER